MKQINNNRKTQIAEGLRPILRELVDRIAEIKGRKNQPDFNKGLDAVCDYDEAIDKIIKLFGSVVEAEPSA